MDLILHIAIAIGASTAILCVGTLIHRAGVRQGMAMARMAWNLTNDTDPLYEPPPFVGDDDTPGTGECG